MREVGGGPGDTYEIPAPRVPPGPIRDRGRGPYVWNKGAHNAIALPCPLWNFSKKLSAIIDLLKGVSLKYIN
jgi:hypothetical protein